MSTILPLFLGSAAAIGWLSISACFEVQQVALQRGPPALEIDDFEDGDDLPRSSMFRSWQCDAWPGPPHVSCGTVTPGFGDGLAEAVRFELQDPPNGSMDYATVFLETRVRLGTLDLGSYESIAFSVKLERSPLSPSEESAEQKASFFVRLRCDGVGTAGDAWIEKTVPLGPEWSSPSIALAELVRPSYVINFSSRECAAKVEALLFLFDPKLPDGEAMAGTLTIDEVSLE